MSNKKYWYMNGDQKVGPFTFSVLNEIREKNGINDETLVSLDDGINWTSYKNISVWSHAAAMTEEDSETKFKPRIGELPLRGNKNSTVLRAERRSRKENNFNPKPSIAANSVEKEQPAQFNKQEERPAKEKSSKNISISKHLFFGFLLSFSIAFTTSSITKDFHLITLNFILNYKSDMVYGYLMILSGVIGASFFYLIIAFVALMFRRPALFYTIICVIGFFAIFGNI